MENKKQVVMLKIASELSSLSTCSRLKVGCVITDEKFNIISGGYNGSVSGYKHCKDINKEKKSPCICVHAEQNAIIRSNQEFKLNKFVFVTTFPCYDCLKLLLSFGVKKIFYINNYRKMEKQLELCKNIGIDTCRVNI